MLKVINQIKITVELHKLPQLQQNEKLKFLKNVKPLEYLILDLKNIDCENNNKWRNVWIDSTIKKTLKHEFWMFHKNEEIDT